MATSSEDPRQVAAILTTRVSMSANVMKRSYMSYTHHHGAKLFTRLAKEREAAIAPGDFPLDQDLQCYVIGSVYCSVGFMEAFINEVFQDAHDNSPSRIAAFTPGAHGVMLGIWALSEEDGKHSKTLSKYQLALRLAGQTEFLKGEDPYQSAALLIELRNFLTHYKPKSLGIGEAGKHEVYELESKLTGRFASNPHMQGTGNSWFPDKAIGLGMAEWALKSSRGLVNSFIQRVGMDVDYGSETV